MEKVSILHLITAAKNASPFDVNMAYDAGFDKIMPYTSVSLDEIAALTQDAIFSRTPSGVKREALFFGGRDISLAIDMQSAAKKAMFSPFAVSTMTDPSGGFTTSGALLAKISQHLSSSNDVLAKQTVAIFGASGTVGSTSALIAAGQGASVKLVAHNGVDKMQAHADMLTAKYGFTFEVLDGSSDEAKVKVLSLATVAITSAPAGFRVLEAKHYNGSTSLKVMADVNAVTPSGIEGIDAQHDGFKIKDTDILGIGALAIGQLKYVTQQKLLQQMILGEKPVHLDYNNAFDIACAHSL
ncbi:MAG TPA: NAD(P)-dependent methylenetetrahydromethanopterin dehydrogenase [Methylophilaceae bacterium]|nr:NAD(P)-dependent methylenetetrahydromethanopterin dehydrogenase [Methylophilaceae bacterium]